MALYGFMRKRKKSRRGRSNLRPLKPIAVALDRLEVELALRLGDGDLTLGVRRAVALASIREV